MPTDSVTKILGFLGFEATATVSVKITMSLGLVAMTCGLVELNV